MRLDCVVLKSIGLLCIFVQIVGTIGSLFYYPQLKSDNNAMVIQHVIISLLNESSLIFASNVDCKWDLGTPPVLYLKRCWPQIIVA